MLTTDGISKRNLEGYMDLTAHDAITNVLKEQADTQEAADQRCNRMIKAVKVLIDMAGYDLIGRIEVRDRATGRKYV